MRGPRGGFRAILPRMSPPVLRFVLGRQPQTLANVPPDRTLLNVLRDDQRMVLMRELPRPQEPDVHALIAQLDSSVDWVLVEGFKDCDLPKLEVLASAPATDGRPPLYPQDGYVQAVVRSAGHYLSPATDLPVLLRDEPMTVAQWLLAHADRFGYTPPCVLANEMAG